MSDAGATHRQFPSTHWSIVETAEGEDVCGPRPALAVLLGRYLPALRAHLTKRGRIPSDRIDDVLQNFVSNKVLESDLFGSADRTRGKFRTLLLTALDRFAISQERARLAEKRGASRTESLDPLSEVARPGIGADAFDVAWAREILRQSLQRMREQCDAEGRSDIWGVFDSRVLGPTLYGHKPAEYDELVQRYSYRSPSQLWNAVRAAKQLFARTMRAVISEYAQSEEDIETELQDLRAICGRMGLQDSDSAAYT